MSRLFSICVELLLFSFADSVGGDDKLVLHLLYKTFKEEYIVEKTWCTSMKNVRYDAISSESVDSLCRDGADTPIKQI